MATVKSHTWEAGGAQWIPGTSFGVWPSTLLRL